MKYKVQVDLGNVKEALAMIAPCGAEHFEEALSLTKKNRLFKQALDLY